MKIFFEQLFSVCGSKYARDMEMRIPLICMWDFVCFQYIHLVSQVWIFSEFLLKYDIELLSTYQYQLRKKKLHFRVRGRSVGPVLIPPSAWLRRQAKMTQGDI